MHVYKGETQKLMLAPDGMLWEKSALRKDGRPNRNAVSVGAIIAMDKWGYVTGAFALVDSHREWEASDLRDQIEAIKAQHAVLLRRLGCLYAGTEIEGDGE